MKYQFAVLLISVFVVNVLCSPANRIEDELLSLITRIKHNEATRHHDPNSDKKSNEDSKHINLKGQTVHATRSMDLQSRSTGSTLTAAERDNILNLHNVARQSVSPPASDMKTMSWNIELASIAQNYADQCKWAHNSNRSSASSKYSYVGENIYVQTSTMSNGVLEGGFTSWDNEKDGYHYDQGNSGECSDPPCGHYTQIIWANSNALGCGVTKCTSMENFPDYSWNEYWEFLVCDYGPGGNYYGERPYTEDTSGGNVDG